MGDLSRPSGGQTLVYCVDVLDEAFLVLVDVWASSGTECTSGPEVVDGGLRDRSHWLGSAIWRGGLTCSPTCRAELNSPQVLLARRMCLTFTALARRHCMKNEGALPLWFLFANSVTSEVSHEEYSRRSLKYVTIISMPMYPHKGFPLFVETIPTNGMDRHEFCCNSLAELTLPRAAMKAILLTKFIFHFRKSKVN